MQVFSCLITKEEISLQEDISLKSNSLMLFLEFDQVLLKAQNLPGLFLRLRVAAG